MKLELKKSEEIFVEGSYLDNLSKKIKQQDQTTRQQNELLKETYLIKVNEVTEIPLFIEVNFYYEEKEKKEEMEVEKEKNILQQGFFLTNHGREKEIKEITVYEYIGKTEVAIVVFENNSFIKLNKFRENILEREKLIERLESLKFFKKEDIESKDYSYRDQEESDEIDIDEKLIERIYSGNLIKLTLEEYFKKRNILEIENISIQHDENEKKIIVYHLNEANIISKNPLDEVTSKTLLETHSILQQTSNFNVFKENFEIELNKKPKKIKKLTKERKEREEAIKNSNEK